MAKESGKSKEQLRDDIDLSRERVARELDGLRYELDFPRKIRKSFQSQTAIWLGAAVALGLVLTFLPRRAKKIYVDPRISVRAGLAGGSGKKKILESAFALALLKIGVSFLRPMLTKFIAGKMQRFAARERAPHRW
ncbi:MAG: hypothetical protein QOI04_2022 [Verrucomicrobiota bacterium]|jgi:hypothetical protein